jgi:hypothetical protein
MGGPLLRHNFNRMSAWAYAVRSIGAEACFPMIYGTPATTSRARERPLRELMYLMGHDSERAAMVYLDGSDARQHQIARTLSDLA